MKRNGFTLIELLVVVAIIGILAAVGVVAYNGYTKAAKINAVKAQHGSIVKYLAAEFQKCDLGYSKIFIDTWKKNLENCPIPAKNAVLIASAADVLTETLKNVYLGSGTSSFESATQKGSVRPCSNKSKGCHITEWAWGQHGNKNDKRFTITSYYEDDGDISDKDSDPDFIITHVNAGG